MTRPGRFSVKSVVGRWLSCPVKVGWITEFYICRLGERGGLVVNASDSGSRGRGFEPHSGQTVLCP